MLDSDFAVDLAGCMLNAQVTLNNKFHRRYYNEHPVWEPLFPFLTLKQPYHLVRVVIYYAYALHKLISILGSIR